MVRAKLGTVVGVIFLGLLVRALAAEEVKCEGAIVKIVGENVTVKDATSDQQMKIEPGTQITSGGKPASAMDLKVGQKVKCICDKRNGQMVCTAMEIMRDTP
jgi:hypothetical protein